MKDSVEPKQLVKAVADCFPHRGVSDVTNQLREAGLVARQQKGRAGDTDPEGLGSKSEL